MGFLITLVITLISVMIFLGIAFYVMDYFMFPKKK